MDKVLDILVRHHPTLGSAEEVAKLLRQILGIESEEISRLDRIEAKVDRLLAKDHNAAMDQVASAGIPGLPDDERRRRLAVARDLLVQAVNAAGSDLTSKCAAEVCLASLHSLMRQKGDAIYWAERAYQTSLDAVATAVGEANRLSLGRFSTNVSHLRRVISLAGSDAKYLLNKARSHKMEICQQLAARSRDVHDLAEHVGVPLESRRPWSLITPVFSFQGTEVRWEPR